MGKLNTLMMLSCLRIDNTYIAFEIIKKKKIATYSQYKQWILCYSRKDIQVLRMLMNIPYILHDILMNISLPKAGHWKVKLRVTNEKMIKKTYGHDGSTLNEAGEALTNAKAK